MRSYSRKVLYLLSFVALVAFSTSCSKKVGCPTAENVHVKTTKKGKVKGKAKSGLHNKKMNRAEKKRKKKSKKKKR